jgi:hypothetical protein
VILEVIIWEPTFVAAFTAASGGRPRLTDLHVSIAACLTAHALNIGCSPSVKKGVEALERDRVSHVNQTCLGTETYSPADRGLIEAQAGIAFAQPWKVGWSPPSTACPSSSPSPASTPVPTGSRSASSGGVT